MGENSINIEFDSLTVLDLRRGDWCVVFSKRYSVIDTPIPEIRKGVFHYNFKMYDTQSELEKVIVFVYDSERDITNSDFPYTCTPSELVWLLVRNLKAAQPNNDWQVGTVLYGEAKTITFTNINCLQALQSAVSESNWDTEYWVDGFTINLCKRQIVPSVPKIMRRGEALKNIIPERNTNQKTISRVYPFGSTKNIPANYGAERLRLPETYLELTDAPYLVEDVKVFEDVYPHRKGTVTGVRVNDSGYYYFTDSGLTFNPNDCMIDGVAKKVIFQSGQLAGYEFEVNYNSTTSEFELINFVDSTGVTLPSDPLVPMSGNEYILINISMPESYVTAAVDELRTKAQAYLQKNASDAISLNLTQSEPYFTANNMTLQLGEMVTVQDDDIPALVQGRNIRVTSFTRYINKPNKYDNIKVSDVVYVNPITNVENKVDEVEKVVTRSGINKPNYFARNWRDVAELSNMIKSLQTELLLVGNKEGDFSFDSFLMPNYAGNKNMFHATAGTLKHNNYPEGNPGTWSFAEFQVSLDNDNKPYYLYAQCTRDNNFAQLYTSDTEVSYDSEPEFYNFLIGVISSVRTNARTFQTTYGFSEISGNQITTGIIQDPAGKVVVNLQTGEVIGTIKFKSGGTTTEVGKALSDNLDSAKQYADTLDESMLSFVNGVKAGLQDQIDGVIIAYFEQYDPTTMNLPSSEWNTDALKNQHANDTFTNTSSGHSWRWVYENSAWMWKEITDTATVQALVAAGNAQESADGKMRVFTSQPIPPYDLGDLWAQGSTGDLMRCKTAKDTGIYSANDWEKASKYTDDTLAQEAKDAANSAKSTADAAKTVTDAIEENVTTIDGGLILTTLIKMIFNEIESAGIAAKSETNDIAFYGGGTLSDAVNLLAKYIVKHDGSLYAAGGRLKALADGTLSLEFTTEIEKYTPTGGVTTVEQTIEINNTYGVISVRTSDNNVAEITSQGIFANRAGIQAVPASSGIELKGAIVGLGFGDLQADAYDGIGAICGVYGDAYNSNASPAPAFGGYFKKLKVVGEYLGVRRISSGVTLNYYDRYVSCYNSTSITVYLPQLPYEGQSIEIRRMNLAAVTVNGNGKSIHGSSLHSSIGVGEGQGDTARFVYDGQYWLYNYYERGPNN